MMSIGLLMLCAVLEAVIWLWRLRAGVGSCPRAAAWSTLGVCATRVLFVYAGVSATLAGDVLIGGAAYCVSAALATWAAHGPVRVWVERRSKA